MDVLVFRGGERRRLPYRMAAAAVLALGLALPSLLQAAPVAFRMDRLAIDQTFSGSGLIEFDGPADDPSDIRLLSVRISTLGTIHPDDGPPTPATFDFVFGTADVVAVSGLALAGGGLTGAIDFARVESDGGGLIAMDFFRLDFGAGLASGFCFYSTDLLAECVENGGSSSAVEAAIRLAPVPLPAPAALLPLALAGLGGLAARRGRKVRSDGPVYL